jgi:hypothetical protein
MPLDPAEIKMIKDMDNRPIELMNNVEEPLRQKEFEEGKEESERDHEYRSK